jgi:hypothetical protein
MTTNNDWLGEMAADAAEVRAPSTEDLGNLAQLIQQQRDLESEIIKMDLALAQKRADLSTLSEFKIPETFKQLGLSKISLADGATVEVKPFYAASISDETRPEAFKWLRKEGLDDMIKHNLTVVLGKGEDAIGKKIAKYFKRIKVTYTDKEAVHPQTLKAFVRERVENAKPIPMEPFHVHIGSKTVIKPAKVK